MPRPAPVMIATRPSSDPMPSSSDEGTLASAADRREFLGQSDVDQGTARRASVRAGRRRLGTAHRPTRLRGCRRPCPRASPAAVRASVICCSVRLPNGGTATRSGPFDSATLITAPRSTMVPVARSWRMIRPGAIEPLNSGSQLCHHERLRVERRCGLLDGHTGQVGNHTRLRPGRQHDSDHGVRRDRVAGPQPGLLRHHPTDHGADRDRFVEDRFVLPQHQAELIRAWPSPHRASARPGREAAAAPDPC